MTAVPEAEGEPELLEVALGDGVALLKVYP